MLKQSQPIKGHSKGDITKQHLRDCALDILCNHGYFGFTVRMVADKAGLAEGALYRHYPSKDALIKELFNQHTDKIVEVIRDIREQSDDETAFLSLLVITLCRLFDESPLSFQMVFWPDIAMTKYLKLDANRPFNEVNLAIEKLLKNRDTNYNNTSSIITAQGLGLIIYTAKMISQGVIVSSMMDACDEIIESLFRMIVRRA